MTARKNTTTGLTADQWADIRVKIFMLLLKRPFVFIRSMFSGLHAHRGFVNLKKKNYKIALNHFERVVQSIPPGACVPALFYESIAECHRGLGDRKKSQEVLKLARSASNQKCRPTWD
ncbi:MAG: hypothetical protein IT367_16690 [Candidatus Hydrogenedentes bacterium]|nr:hypothetical protein [Candidatus Hydrogenedentota bacterium]